MTSSLARLTACFSIVASVGVAGGNASAISPDGELDTNFGKQGVVTASFGPGEESASKVLIQPNGKIVVAGTSDDGFTMVRYNSNGSLDTTFDADGKVSTQIGSKFASITSLAIQADGKIVAAGNAGLNGDQIIGLARYNSNGSLDTTFDADGIVTTQIRNQYPSEFTQAINIQPDGKILIAGFSQGNSNSDLFLVRYNDNGALDTSFDADGIKTLLTADYVEIGEMKTQNDGKIVLVGSRNNSPLLMRINPDGGIDTSFGNAGFTAPNLGSKDGMLHSVSLQTDGKIIAGGSTFGSINSVGTISRYMVDGSLDTSFNDDGKREVKVPSQSVYLQALQIQADGKIIAAGLIAEQENREGTITKAFVMRISKTGVPDTSFAGDGLATYSVKSHSTSLVDIALQGDSKIVGVGDLTKSSDSDFYTIRINVAALGIVNAAPQSTISSAKLLASRSIKAAAGSKVKLSVKRSSLQFCQVVNGQLTMLSPGNCVVSIAVTPKATSKVRKPKTSTTSVTVRIK